eukprot:UN24807
MDPKELLEVPAVNPFSKVVSASPTDSLLDTPTAPELVTGAGLPDIVETEEPELIITTPRPKSVANNSLIDIQDASNTLDNSAMEEEGEPVATTKEKPAEVKTPLVENT